MASWGTNSRSLISYRRVTVFLFSSLRVLIVITPSSTVYPRRCSSSSPSTDLKISSNALENLMSRRRAVTGASRAMLAASRAFQST